MPARRRPSSDAFPAGKKTTIGIPFGDAVSNEAAFEEIVGLIEQSRLQAVSQNHWQVREVARQMDVIAEYETLLPDKALLRAKLHEFYQLCAPSDDAGRSSPLKS